jgi:hypothetical protein
VAEVVASHAIASCPTRSRHGLLSVARARHRRSSQPSRCLLGGPIAALLRCGRAAILRGVMGTRRDIERKWREGADWRAMAKSIGFVYGVPIGITVGVIVGAFLEIDGEPHAAATGILIGFASGVVLGAGVAVVEIKLRLRWIRELTDISDDKWAAVVMALNDRAAQKHYLMVRSEGDYLAYSPMLVRPVAAGPLTVSGEYLSVIVSRLPAEKVAIIGPKYMVQEFKEAADDARGPKREGSAQSPS